MNNRSFDGVVIILCVLTSILFAWTESSDFILSDRLVFVSLIGFAALWVVSTVYTKPASVKPSVQKDDSIEQFTQKLDETIETLSSNPEVATVLTMSEAELLHLMVDRLDRQYEESVSTEEPIVLPPVATPAKTKTAAKSRRTAAAATVKEGKTRSTTARKTTASSKARSTKRSGEV